MPYINIVLQRIKSIFKPPKPTIWQSIEYFDESWKNRIARMVSLLPLITKSIVDLGCGKMWLKEFLHSDITYYGVDYTKREDETIICDLNRQEFPKIYADCYFLSGIVEYINNVNWLCNNLSRYTNVVILSYCSKDSVKYRQPAWVNHFSRIDLLNKFEETGFKMEKMIENFNGNDIFLLIKKQK